MQTSTCPKKEGRVSIHKRGGSPFTKKRSYLIDTQGHFLILEVVKQVIITIHFGGFKQVIITIHFGGC